MLGDQAFIKHCLQLWGPSKRPMARKRARLLVAGFGSISSFLSVRGRGADLKNSYFEVDLTTIHV